MQVLLIDPAQRQGVPEMYENLGIASLAASSSRADFATETLLAHVEGWSYRRLGREIMNRQPDVLGVSLLSFNAGKTLNMLHRLKVEGLRSRIVLGGHFPTFNDLQLIQQWPAIDVVVRGEGDVTLVELLRTWAGCGGLEEVKGITYRRGGEIRSNPVRPLIGNLDTLPWPIRDYTQRIVEMGGALNMVRSRGCYGNCAFCSIASFYRAQGGAAWRQRSRENVLAEMAHLADRYPGTELKFHDDQFIGPGKRGWEEAMAFAHGLIDSGIQIPFYIFARADTVEPELFRILKAAGLKSVFVGVESGSQRELEAFNKRTTVEENRRALQVLYDLDIASGIGLILFSPYTEMEDVTASIRFLRQTQPLWSSKGNILSVENRVDVYKGTPFYDRLRAEDRLEGNYLDCTYTIPDWRARYLCRMFHLLLNYLLPTIRVVRLLPARLRLMRRRLSWWLRRTYSVEASVSESAG